MKPTNVLLKRYKKLYPVKFQHILPLKLKDSISGKSDKQTEQICLEEMNSLLTCFKDKDFNQNFCLNEINQFKDCYSSYMIKKQKAETEKNIYNIHNKDLNYKQVNKILKKFPQPR